MQLEVEHDRAGLVGLWLTMLWLSRAPVAPVPSIRLNWTSSSVGLLDPPAIGDRGEVLVGEQIPEHDRAG